MGKTIVLTDKTQRRIDPKEFANAIGGEMMTAEQAQEWTRRHGSIDQHFTVRSADQQPKHKPQAEE